MKKQKIKDITENSFRNSENILKRKTCYHDLKGQRHSTQKRHKQTLNQMFADKDTKLSDITRFCKSIGLKVGSIPIYKEENDNSIEEAIKFTIMDTKQSELNTSIHDLVSKDVEFKDEHSHRV